MVKRIEYPNGRIEFINEYGNLHRDDGPAVIWSDGEVSWFLKGRIYSFKEWCELVNISDELKMELGLKYG